MIFANERLVESARRAFKTTLICSASGAAMMLYASAAAAQTGTLPSGATTQATTPTPQVPGAAPQVTAPDSPAATPSVAPPPSSTAATPPADSSEIVVTGSRITAAGFDAPTPTQVLGADLLAKAAQPNIFTAITQLPSLQGSTGTTVANGNTSTGQTGLSGLNLRGLGTFRTLTLLDGQRVVASNVANITDISQFPQLLVQRVEVVTGGASASYGSDAVAGVVNFITNKRFEGIKLNIQGGITTYGDDKQGTIQAAYGKSMAGGKLHFEVSGEAFHSDGILPGGKFGGLPVNGRPRRAQTGAPAYSLTGTPAGQPQTTYYLDGAQNIVQGPNGLITSGPLQGTFFGPGGVPQTFNYGGSGIPNRTAAGGVAGCIQTTCQGGDFFGPNSTAGGDAALDARINRYVGYGRLSYELTDRLEIYGTANIANVYTVTQPTQGIPQANLFASCGNNPAGTVVGGQDYSGPPNAFLPASIIAACARNNITSFRFGTIGQNLPHYLDVKNSRKQRRFVIGLDGSFDVFGKKWTFESYYEKGKTTTDINVRNNVLRARYNRATDAILLNGQIVCRDPLARANGCIAYNPFGSDIQNSEAAFRYFAPATGSRSHAFLKQDAASLAINGVPFKDWAGDVSVAFGAEYRKERYAVVGDPYGAGFNNSPANADYPADSILTQTGGNYFAGNFLNGSGGYNVKEAFLELGIPIFNNGFLGNLTFNPAVRETDYSTSGRVTTWKLGATWETALDGLRLRAVKSRDIRAPNLSDLFAAPQTVNNQFTNRVFTPAVPNTPGSVDVAAGAPVVAPQRTGGNPLLKPEIASNIEVGAVYSPTFLPGLRLSVDYFNIKLKSAIQVFGGQQVIDLCQVQNNATFCGTNSFILNGTPGSPYPTYVNTQPFNVASIKTRGLDFEASYKLNLARIGMPGSFTFRGLATRTIDYTVNTGVPGAAIFQLAGNNSRNDNAPGFVGVAKWKAFLQQSLDEGAATFTVTERIISSGKINPNLLVCQPGSCPAPTVQVPTANFNYVPGVVYVDLGFSYKLNDPVSFFAKVDNLTNKQLPPFGSNSLYDQIGRRFTGGVRVNF